MNKFSTGICALFLAVSSCSLPLPKERETTCYQQFGVIDFSMSACGCPNQPIRSLRVRYQIPRSLMNSRSVKEMNQQEIMEWTGIGSSLEHYGIPMADVQMVWTNTSLVLTILFQSKSLFSYLQNNKQGDLTIETYTDWFLSTAGREIPAVCS